MGKVISALKKIEQHAEKFQKRVRFRYLVVVEDQCRAHVDYVAYRPEYQKKSERSRRCVFMTIRSCGFCLRHCRMFCVMRGRH